MTREKESHHLNMNGDWYKYANTRAAILGDVPRQRAVQHTWAGIGEFINPEMEYSLFQDYQETFEVGSGNISEIRLSTTPLYEKEGEALLITAQFILNENQDNRGSTDILREAIEINGLDMELGHFSPDTSEVICKKGEEYTSINLGVESADDLIASPQYESFEDLEEKILQGDLWAKAYLITLMQMGDLYRYQRLIKVTDIIPSTNQMGFKEHLERFLAVTDCIFDYQEMITGEDLSEVRLRVSAPKD